MGVVELRQIRNKLDRDFCPTVDMSDYETRPQPETLAACRSRALAAFVVSELVSLDPASATSCLTDGFDDNGIDALYVDSTGQQVLVVQSKWQDEGKGSPSVGDVQKFAQGFRDLLFPRLERFNDKVRAHEPDLIKALDNTAVHFQLVLAYSGQSPLSEHAHRVFQDLLDEVNDVSEVASVQVLRQADLHSFVRRGVGGRSPDLRVTLHDWGKADEPYVAFYGQVEATEVAEWWKQHQATLFDRNLRMFLSDSAVNASMTETLLTEPTNFWYFNNGITVLCDRITKAPKGGSSRRAGSFTFEGVTVVNGAQTVGSIGKAAERNAAAVEGARTHVRFISLEQCPPTFATAVTRATNTQNRIERRDFVALDDEQARLRTDLELDEDKIYAIKTGDADPEPTLGCNVVEATLALACEHSPELAVQAKREVGRLWDDVTKAPYTTLFNRQLTATHLWRAVEVLRKVDDTLRKQQSLIEGRMRQVAVHGNRVIAHVVFARLGPAALLDRSETFDAAKTVPDMTEQALMDVSKEIEGNYANNYLTVLFKNASKCRDLVAAILLDVA